MKDKDDKQAMEVSAVDAEGQAFRDKLEAMFRDNPVNEGDMLFNLGMFVRSSLLAKFLAMDDLYKRIVGIPGDIFEFGVWWGQNLVLMENLRAIHEPFNKERRIIGFDTFTGYEGFTDRDVTGGVMTDGTYATTHDYKEFLSQLLETHEGNNLLGHIRGSHKLIAGNVADTSGEYFEQHPEAIVALAYFDIGTYEPTRAALEAIKPNLIPGSVILLDELTWSGSPGEAIAFKEVFRDMDYKIEKSLIYPSRSIVTVSG